MLKIQKPMPKYIRQELDKIEFNNLSDSSYRVKNIQMSIPEEDAFTYIHPEDFSFCDVYGDCQFLQVNEEILVEKFQFHKNYRSFEKEAANQQDLILAIILQHCA